MSSYKKTTSNISNISDKMLHKEKKWKNKQYSPTRNNFSFEPIHQRHVRKNRVMPLPLPFVCVDEKKNLIIVFMVHWYKFARGQNNFMSCFGDNILKGRFRTTGNFGLDTYIITV